MIVSLENILQVIINGILQGGFITLAALGFSFIFGVQKILNVAHGAFIILASFITIDLSLSLTPVFGIDPILFIPLDFALLFLFGTVVYTLLLSRIERSGFEGPILITFGISILIEYLVGNGLGPIPPMDPSRGIGAQAEYQAYSSTAFIFGPIYLQEASLISLLLAIILVPTLHLFLTKTYLGKAIRAASEDMEAASFSGIDVRKVRLLSFAIGSGLAGVAGGVFSMMGSVTPSAGDTTLLPLILMSVIIGGLGSIIGTFAGSILLGILLSLGSYLALNVFTGFRLHSDLTSLIAFALFLAFLMLRPSGLFGRELQD
jgi:branched-chain amino acid transport system permease protein